MRFVKKMSIRSKLIAILLLLSLISLVIGFGIVITHDIATFRNELVETGNTIARVIGDYSVVDLTFRDPEASRETLAKLNSIDHVDCAFLYDASGTLFSTYAKGDCLPHSTRFVQAEFQSEFLHLSQPIQDKDRKYGTIYLRISTEGLQRKISRYVLTMVTLLVALVVLSFLVALRLQRIISRPLIELAEATKRVTDELDYSIRVSTDSTDEMGVLFKGFNRMLGQIEQRKQERDRAENALRESEHRYRVLVESSPEAIFLEQQDSIVYANPAGITLTGYSPEELRGRSMNDLIEPFSGRSADALPRETVMIRKEGATRDVELLSSTTSHNGQPAIQYLVRDVTESKSLREAAGRMERLAAVGEFSAMLAHEIRNAVGSVALNVRLLSERMEVPPNFKKNLENMQLGIQRTQEIMKAILDFARPASPRMQPIHLNKLMDSSLHLVEQELDQNGIVIEKQYDPSDPVIQADLNQMSQALMNLFLNALHAMETGGKITITTAQRDHAAELQVSDTGKGIPAENLKRIFDPFFTTTPRGVGLGLAFVLRIIEQHHAQILVESSVGAGTLFTIRFPVAGRT